MPRTDAHPPSESRPEDPSSDNSLNTGEGSDSVAKTKVLVTESDSVHEEAMCEQPAHVDHNRHMDFNPGQSKESICSGASSSSNASCWKCANCDASNETTDTADEERERPQGLRDDPSNDSQKPTSTESHFHRSNSQNLSPTDQSNTSYKHLPLLASQPEDKQLSATRLKYDQPSFHSLSSDANSCGVSDSGLTSQTPTNSRHSIASDNRAYVKLRKSIISPVESFSAPDNDCLATSKTDLSKAPSSPSRTPATSDICDWKNQGTEISGSVATTIETSHTGNHVLESRQLRERSHPQTASNSPDESFDHRLTSPNLTESNEHEIEKSSSRSYTPQQFVSYPPFSPIDDQQIFKPFSSYHQSKETLTQKNLPAYYEDQTIEQAEASNSSSSRDNTHIAYIPDLPLKNLTSQEFESMLRESLQLKNKLHVVNVNCHTQFNFGIVYLQNKKDKDHLVNTIGRIFIGPNSDRSVSFVAELEFVSYVVVKFNDTRDLPHTNDIQQQWTQFYQGKRPLKCKRLRPDFPNIFRIVINTVEELITAVPVTELNIGGQTGAVYFRADCCFFVALPRNITESDLYSVISDQLSPTNLSKANIYIQLNRVERNAIVLTCHEAQRWRSFNSISLNGQVFMKKDRLTYCLRLKSVPSNILTSSIEKHPHFANTVLKVIPSGKDIVVELSSKDLYDICLQQRVLHIDGHVIDIETNSFLSQDEDSEINASSWYETEMTAGRSTIMQFITEPEHRIFRLKWNSHAFLEQFCRWPSQNNPGTGIEHDHQETLSNQQRHLLRMTVMLNTIGIIKRGSYFVNDKEIKLKSDQLNTIVYNHQSKLQREMTIPLSAAINYPYKSTSVRVINKDCLIVYQQMVSQGSRPLLLNMANAKTPGGGYRKGDGAQEENIFRRSDYYRSLDLELDQGNPTARFYCTSKCELAPLTDGQKMYPMDEFGAIYTSGLSVFRQPEDTGYEFMDKPVFNVCALAIAAYRNPKLTEKNRLSLRYSIGTRKKIETVFAIAKHHNHDCLILSAFGCGAFRNPPKHVATIFKSVIEQYAGFFKDICFAIIDDHNTGQDFNPHGNYQPFHEILDGLKVEPIRHMTVNMMIGPWRILNETSNKQITLSDVRICYLPPCHYGAKCRDIENKSHCREYLHPPRCPLTASSKGCQSTHDDDHMLWFRHSIKHSNDAHINPSKIDDENVNTKLVIDDHHSLAPICPWTPFYCRKHTVLAESTDPQALPLDVRNHCCDFRHVCRFGRQCRQTSSLHWETTIHIAREMCRDGEKCSKIHQENHLNSFSHPGIADIRRLCTYAGHECRDRRKPEHFVRYRHSGNYDRSSVIPYRGLNNQINFLRNQQELIASIHDYTERLKLKTPLSIPHLILKCIEGLSPIYQCSKAMFELILVHGHVMSGECIEQLTSPLVLVQTIQQNKHIQAIIVQHKHQAVEDHINNYIKAIISAEYSTRSRQPQSKTTEYKGTASSYSLMAIPDENFNDTIRKEERFLRDILNHEGVDTIRQWTIKITEALLNLPTNLVSADQRSKKHITTIFGPHLRHNGGDIVLVLKREVMFHPDANFALQSKASYLDGRAFIRRPWVQDSGTHNERLKQFYQSQLHRSIYECEYAAAIELLATIDMTKKTMDIDLEAILRYMSTAHSDQLFEGYLPESIPLDYIEEVYMSQTLFDSLIPSAQMLAKTAFRHSLHIISHQENRYQDHINDKLIQKLNEYIERPQKLRGSIITLPPSQLKEYVTLPFTLAQLYDQYRRNPKQNSISDDIYIYWQSMYGDMMMALSNEPIDSAKSPQYIRSLMCYIAETPSTTTSAYQESYSYLNSGHPSQHATIMDKRSFLAYSNTFHRGCNVDDYLIYCLKLQKTTGQVTLSHVGPNSIYNYETISYGFTKSNLDLNELNYIQISAGSQRVPIRDMVVCFHPLPDLHPPFEKHFRRNSIASNQPKAHSSPSPHSSAASNNEKSSVIFSKLNHAVGGFVGSDFDQKILRPCRDSINCLLQASDDHCKKYSHPCRFSELCRNKDKEPHLTHEPHRVDKCVKDTSCLQINDPYHRAMFRHTGRPDFLIPCRDQLACRNRSSEHRIKYSHSEKVHLKSATAVEKPQTPFRKSIISSESDPKEQPNMSYHGSHPSEQRPRSSANHDHLRPPCRFGSAGNQANDSTHYSPYSYSDVPRDQPRGIDYHQKTPCQFGIGCQNYDSTHRSNYSH